MIYAGGVSFKQGFPIDNESNRNCVFSPDLQMKSSSFSQVMNNILSTKQPVMVALRFLLAAGIVIIALSSTVISIRSLVSPAVYQKDLMQEYLMGRAVLDAISPYLPMPELAGKFLSPLPVNLLPHPSVHPPFVVLLGLPLGLLPYEQAAILWFVVEVLLILISVFILTQWLVTRPTKNHYLTITFFLLLWTPFKDELVVGQLMSLMMLLLILAWLSLREGKGIWGGIGLGMVFSIKLFAWPLIIYLALKKKWEVIISFVGTVLVTHVIAVFLIGFSQVTHYYTEVGPSVAPLYQAHERNFSLWTIGYRIFSGTYSPVIAGIEAPPVVYSLVLALILSSFLPLMTLVIGLGITIRIRSFDAAFAMMVCISLLVNPVVWSHYLILAVLPVAIMIKQMELTKLDRINMKGIIIVGVLLLVGVPLRGLLFIASGTNPQVGSSIEVPFIASLVTLAPAAAVFGLMWAICQLERFRAIQ